MGKRGPKARSLKERLWLKVLKTPTCWLWTGAVKSKKYRYGIVLSGEIKPKLIQTHRAVWELTFGPIPKGLCVLHNCDNPPCVNPAHLRLGTLKENSKDMVNRNRNPSLLKKGNQLAKGHHWKWSR